MATQYGPLEVVCDAPDYVIVQACAQVGFVTPEDVRWRRLSEYLGDLAEFLRSGHSIPGMDPVDHKTKELVCNCGRKLPPFQTYLFELSDGTQYSYFLSQCPRCHTIYW